jgi:sulfur relay (sulfurtransferase) DsrF/TusC family protein
MTCGSHKYDDIYPVKILRVVDRNEFTERRLYQAEYCVYSVPRVDREAVLGRVETYDKVVHFP